MHPARSDAASTRRIIIRRCYLMDIRVGLEPPWIRWARHWKIGVVSAPRSIFVSARVRFPEHDHCNAPSRNALTEAVGKRRLQKYAALGDRIFPKIHYGEDMEQPLVRALFVPNP